MKHQSPLKSIIIFLVSLSCILIVSCAAPVRQFYPDTYYPEDRVYENKPLRFVLQFQGNWEIITDPNAMDKNGRELAKRCAKSGVELLFVGTTAEGWHATRGMAVNFNEPAREYAEYVRKINAKEVQNDNGLTDMVVGRNSMIKWVYDKGNFRFAEYFFSIGTYDIRISFWTKSDLFEKFLPVYEAIISSLEVTGGL